MKIKIPITCYNLVQSPIKIEKCNFMLCAVEIRQAVCYHKLKERYAKDMRVNGEDSIVGAIGQPVWGII